MNGINALTILDSPDVTIRVEIDQANDNVYFHLYLCIIQ